MPLLTAGEPLSGEVRPDAPVAATENLTRQFTNAVVRGTRVAIRTPAEGSCYIDARSHFFDTYLVLRDLDGEVLAEDDDGLVATHSRIAGAVLEPGTSYILDVCALHGGHGPFTLRMKRGEPETVTPAEHRRQSIRELEESVRQVEQARGANHPDTGTALSQLGTALEDGGRYVEAASRREHALAIALAHHGPDHAETARSRNNLATTLQELGRHDRAEELYRQALSSFEKSDANDPNLAATLLNNLAAMAEHRGHYDEAIALYEEALSRRRQQLGRSHPEVAQSLNNLGACAKRSGDFETARAYYNRALRMIVKVSKADHPVTISFRRNLADLDIEEGRLDAADAELRRIEAITRGAYGENDPRNVPTLITRAAILQLRGRYDAAAELYTRALSLREERLGRDNIHTARVLVTYAGLLDEQGRFEEARPLYRRALELRTQQLGEDHPDTIRLRRNYGVHLASLDLKEDAIALLERNVELSRRRFGDDHPTTATSEAVLATFLASAGELSRARTLLTDALAKTLRAFGPDHRNTDRMQYSLAYLELQSHDLEAAERLLRATLATRRKTLGEQHVLTAVARSVLAEVLAERGQPAAALPLARASVATLDTVLGAVHADSTRARRRLAQILADVGKLPEAVATADLALRSADAQTRRVFTALNENERLRYTLETRRILDLFLSLQRSSELSHRKVLAWKGRVSRSLLADGALRRQNLSTQDNDRLAQLRTLQSRLSDEIYRSDLDAPEARARRIEALQMRRQSLEQELLEAARGLGTANDPPILGHSEILERMPDDSIALDFLVHSSYQPAPAAGTSGGWSAPRVSVWILGRANGKPTVTCQDLGPADDLQRAVTAYLEGLVARRGVRVVDSGPDDTAGRLRALLWDPIEASVDGASTIVVSADGFLGTLPFETIEMADASFLIEKHAFVYYQDLTALPEADAPTTRSSLLLAGAVDYRKREPVRSDEPSSAGPDEPTDDRRDEPSDAGRGGYRAVWRPLSATREEVDAVADVHGEAFEGAPLTLLTRDSATEERIRTEMSRHAFVHLATHGYFQPEGLKAAWGPSSRSAEPTGDDRRGTVDLMESVDRATTIFPGLLSGLVFAGANAPVEPGRANGLLTAEEITYLDLTACSLVVLSACQTGLGTPSSGEGLLGLRRSLRQAGARTVISSLWSVLDEATRDLMVLFYENLWLRKMNKLEALRQAQLDILRRNRAEYGEGLPSSWGAFVLDGAWR